ncbi:MAG: heavy metal-responsive transcriptional regulator [Gemmataceae bacterium]|nr:heavy metal-responsive transcriptional regulator [Gemmataceae bacterium]
MGTWHTIGELARISGVPTSTVRYYERIGLVHPDGRSEGNYRLYGEEAVERLRFIRAAQATGFTLEDVTALLNLRDGATACCKEVQVLIEQRLADVKQRMQDLRHVQGVLKSSLEKCRRTEQSGHCEVLDRLKAASSAKPSRRSHS